MRKSNKTKKHYFVFSESTHRKDILVYRT